MELDLLITQDGETARECDKNFTFNTADKEIPVS
jgi:hypothetical protein